MKILIDARLYGLENTGIGRYIINLVDQYARLDKDNNFTLLLRKNYFDKLKLPENWDKVLADFRPYTFEEQLKLPRIIQMEKPDLVHFPHFNIPVFWRGKFVVTIHDMNMHKQGIDATRLPLPLYLIKRIPYKFTFSMAIKSSVKVITPTNEVKSEVVNYFKIDPDKVAVTYEGINTSFFKKTRDSVLQKYGIKDNYFIYTGNVYPHKNISSLIEAEIRLNNKLTEKVKLIIVCSRNVFTDNLQQLIKEKGATNLVTYLGFVPDNDLVSLYRYSKGFVYPSFSEGFGLQGLETMASGSVVLASNIPIFKEIYSEYAFYFDPRSVESIAAAMGYVLELDGEKRNALIEKSREFIKKYSWEKTARKTLEIYKTSLA